MNDKKDELLLFCDDLLLAKQEATKYIKSKEAYDVIIVEWDNINCVYNNLLYALSNLEVGNKIEKLKKKRTVQNGNRVIANSI